ncbi:alanine racemase [Streptomyces sp. NPDC058486]|uniref:alanine racemase n=1 Tax=unclassified Streptomyces TaxID=2593676 RepID=UPI00365EDF1C
MTLTADAQGTPVDLLGLGVRSAAELEHAVSAGFPPERILLHGIAQAPADLDTALRLGVGRIVIDRPAEIARLATVVGPRGRQKVMLRVAPGIGEQGEPGLSLRDGHAQHAVVSLLGRPEIELTGLYCHLGCRITETKSCLTALRRLVGLMARVRDAHGVVLPELVLGCGPGTAHRPGEPVLDPTALARRLRAALAESCAVAGLLVPRLLVEPAGSAPHP